MGPGRGTMLLAFICLVYVFGSAVSFQCQTPNWNTERSGPDPFQSRRGKVVVVALFKGYCGYCVHQAGRLQALKDELTNEGYPDVDMVIINGGEPRSSSRVNNLINASPLTVIQDTPDHHLYRDVVRGYKDDFRVYDRCNQAAFYIPHPYSDLSREITKHVIKAVYNGNHNCYCSLDYAPQNPDDMMQGDDPGVRFYQTRQMTRNVLRCNANDLDCLRYQTALNHFSSRQRRFQGRAAFRRYLQALEQQASATGSASGVGGGRGFGAGGRSRGFGSGSRSRFNNRRYQHVARSQSGNRVAGGV